MSRWRGMYLQYSRRRPPRAARAVAGQDVPSRRWPRAQCSCARRVQLWLLRADAGVTGARKPPRQRRDETVSTHCRRLVRHGIPEEKWSPPFFRADPGQADCTQGRRLVLGCNLTPLVQSHTVPTTTIRCPPRCGRIARPCPDMYSVTVWLKRPAQSAPRAPLGGGGSTHQPRPRHHPPPPPHRPFHKPLGRELQRGASFAVALPHAPVAANSCGSARPDWCRPQRFYTAARCPPHAHPPVVGGGCRRRPPLGPAIRFQRAAHAHPPRAPPALHRHDARRGGPARGSCAATPADTSPPPNPRAVRPTSWAVAVVVCPQHVVRAP